MGELWTCPKCGAKLVVRNGVHACGDHSVERFLSGASERGKELFDRFVAVVAACGPYVVAPAKTRVAFQALVRFASVNRVGRDSLDVHFVLPRTVASPRIRRVDHLGDLHVHHVQLVDDADFDDQLQGWIRAAYMEYGQRTWLARPS